MGFFKKLKFWRRRDRAVSQKQSEKHRENLEEGGTNTVQMLRCQVAQMLEILEQRDREEANLRQCITDYEKTFEMKECLKNDAETEGNLFGLKKLKEEDTQMDQMEATYCEKISVLEKELENAKFFKSEAENKMCGLEKRLKEKDREMCQMETAYREKIIMLEKKLEGQFVKNDTEVSLHGLGKPSKEKDSERDNIEGTYHDKIIGLERELQLAEAKMCGLENMLKEKDSKRNQLKTTYREKITVLERKLKVKDIERVEAIRNLRSEMEAEMEATLFAEATLRSEKSVMEGVMEETERRCRQVETMLHAQISQTEALERKLQKQMCFQKGKVRDWKNVENALRGQVKQLKQTVSLMDRHREKVMEAQTDAQCQTDGMYEGEIILNSQIKELNGKLEEQMNIRRQEKRDWKNVERALRDQIKQLKITIAVMESDNQTVIRHPYQIE